MRDFYLQSVKLAAVPSLPRNIPALLLLRSTSRTRSVINQDLKDGQWDGYRTDSDRYKAYTNPSILGDAGRWPLSGRGARFLPELRLKWRD
jgi:hypothetical protein